ncbi:MAG: DUF3598 family protein [Cyanobacteria bacterium P01_D01_bin.105]
MTSKSQWDCIRQNMGVWHGSFKQFSADGVLLKDTPSVLSLKETAPNQTMALTLERSPQDEPKKVNTLTFTYPGPAPYTYFFESGAFSQGSAQWSSFGQFVTEFSLKVGDRRVRFVVAYEGTPSYTSALNYVTLICETQTGGTPFKIEPVALQQMMGTWQGGGEMLSSADGRLEKSDGSQWQLVLLGEHLLTWCCKEQPLGQRAQSVDAQSVDAQLVEMTGDKLTGEAALATQTAIQTVVPLKDKKSAIPYQLMLLPNRAYCLLPQEIRRDCSFRIEVGWLSEWGERSRFIRYYDRRGVWTHSALLTDTLSSPGSSNSV